MLRLLQTKDNDVERSKRFTAVSDNAATPLRFEECRRSRSRQHFVTRALGHAKSASGAKSIPADFHAVLQIKIAARLIHNKI